MAAAAKDTIAIPHCATGGKRPLNPQCGALQPAETKFLEFLEYIGVKDPALILINAS